MFIDSHCHLHMIDYASLGMTAEEVIASSLQAKVKRLLCVSTLIEDYPKVLQYANDYAHIDASFGIHPLETKQLMKASAIIAYVTPYYNKTVAIGETGLDLYKSDDYKLQEAQFKEHIYAALELQKPLIIHSRMAKKETLAVIKETNAHKVGGVLHCFTEDWDMASCAMDNNFYISFSGIVTFKNATSLQEIAAKIPLERMLIETDSPYLAPNPYRGKINQPLYVTKVAEFIANLRKVPVEVIAEHTSNNYYKLFSVTKS